MQKKRPRSVTWGPEPSFAPCPIAKKKSVFLAPGFSRTARARSSASRGAHEHGALCSSLQASVAPEMSTSATVEAPVVVLTTDSSATAGSPMLVCACAAKHTVGQHSAPRVAARRSSPAEILRGVRRRTRLYANVFCETAFFMRRGAGKRRCDEEESRHLRSVKLRRDGVLASCARR